MFSNSLTMLDVPFCHSCSLSVIPAPLLSFLLPFCHSCESRNPVLVVVACEKEKATTLDPLLDWIPD